LALWWFFCPGYWSWVVGFGAWENLVDYWYTWKDFAWEVEDRVYGVVAIVLLWSAFVWAFVWTFMWYSFLFFAWDAAECVCQ
jgi:hypothetical protein